MKTAKGTSKDSAAEKEILSLLEVAVDGLGGKPRPGQQKMAVAVHKAMLGAVDSSGDGESSDDDSDSDSRSRRRRHLAVQAGTGTGKSLAYLIPAAHRATRSELPVIVSTATIALQRQLVQRDLPRLAEALADELPEPLEAAILKGRNNYLCLNKVEGNGITPEMTEEAEGPGSDELFDEPQSQIGRQVKRLHEWAQETEDGDRDSLDFSVSDRAWRQVSVTSRECLGASRCAFAEECFAESARRAAQEAHIVVTNHALLAIDAMSEVDVLPAHDIVVIDEAHELESRITATATSELHPTGVAIMAKRAAKLNGNSDAGDKLTTALEDWLDAVRQAVEETTDRWGESSIESRWTSVPEQLVGPLKALKDAAWKANRSIAATPAGEAAEDPEKSAERRAVLTGTEEIHDTVVRILDASTVGAGSGASSSSRSTDTTDTDDLLGEDVVWLSVDRQHGSPVTAGTPVVRVAPLSVAELLRKRLFSTATVVLTSATLALGGKFSAMLSSWGLAASTPTLDVGTPFDAARHGILYLAQHLPDPGGPSRTRPKPEAVDEIAQLINAAGGRTLGLFSSRTAAENMADELRGLVPYEILLQGEDSLSALVKHFSEDPETCLFGTLGLWQGVDVPGPSLSLVIMDKIPFPRPDDPLKQARKEAADQAGRSGFMEVAANHAALLMAQGAGRLLRSVDDKGVVAVLDPRLATKRYGSYIRTSMPDFWTTTDGEKVRGALRRLNELNS